MHFIRPMMTVQAWLTCLSLLAACGVELSQGLQPQPRGCSTSRPAFEVLSPDLSRRALGGWLTGLAVTVASTPAAQAKVTIDIARYGDKELKIAAVNKIKQLLRNELLTNPAQASSWLKLSLSDALSFDAATGEGGPNGGVQFVADKMKWKGAAAAVKTLREIRSQVQRTTEVSFADVLAYAGAEAVEASGGPRAQVQVGRDDATKPAASYFDWGETGDGAGLGAAFVRAGFSGQDQALLVGAVAGVERAVATASNKGTAARIDPEDDEDSLFPADGGIFIPSTFGSQKLMYGDLLTKEPFDQTVFKSVLGSASLDTGDAKAAAQKYVAGKREVFVRDLVDALQRLTIAGASVTGAKVLAP